MKLQTISWDKLHSPLLKRGTFLATQHNATSCRNQLWMKLYPISFALWRLTESVPWCRRITIWHYPGGPLCFQGGPHHLDYQTQSRGSPLGTAVTEQKLCFSLLGAWGRGLCVPPRTVTHAPSRMVALWWTWANRPTKERTRVSLTPRGPPCFPQTLHLTCVGHVLLNGH